MCLSCGCGMPNDDHGEPANITAQDLQDAAEAANISTEQAATNIASGTSDIDLTETKGADIAAGRRSSG